MTRVAHGNNRRSAVRPGACAAACLAAALLAGTAAAPGRADDPARIPGQPTQYAAWLHEANRAIRDESIPASQRAGILMAKARFFDVYVGDASQSIQIAEQVRRLGLEPAHPAVIAAGNHAARLRARLDAHRAQGEFLRQMAVGARDDDERLARVRELTKMAAQGDAGPYDGAVCYHLGAHGLELKRYREARAAFDEALRLRPAIGFALPVPHRRALAHRKWLETVSGRAARLFLAAFALGTGALFLAARPWRWLGLRHALALAALGAAWCGLFRLAAWRIGPAGGPGLAEREVLGALFRYGLIGVLGVWVCAAATARLRHRSARVMLNLLLALLLFAGLTVEFVLRECRTAAFMPGGTRLAWLRGRFEFTTTDILPYVLIDPRAWPDLAIEELDEAPIREFVRQHQAPRGGGDTP